LQLSWYLQEMNSIESYKNKRRAVVTIGTFDGVHIGHQKIIKRLIKTARTANLDAVILTFFPHPRMVLQKDSNIKLINTIDERGHIIEGLGVDYLLVKKFTHEFSRLSAEDFVKQILVDKLHAKKVIIGYDHRFGRNRNANIENLKAYGEQYNFEVEEISVQDIDDVAVSSTKIREALNSGNIEKANRYLGYQFMITGRVIKGKGLGNTLGFPTANIQIDETYKLIPKYVSYVVSALIGDTTVYGMLNIGVNPTVDGEKENIEVHFFNFSQDIYNINIQLKLLHRLRDEVKFDSLEALKNQLLKDVETSLNYLKTSSK